MAKDLLSEAIADAKAIRAVALENAKASIAEAFAPQIKNMISTRLQEEESVDDEEMMEDGYMYEAEDEEMMEDGYMYEAEDEEDMEEGFMYEAEDEEDMMEDGYMYEAEDEEDMMEDGYMYEAEDEEDMDMEEAEDMDMEEGEDQSLDEIIAELEQQLSEAEGEDDEELEEAEDEEDMKESTRRNVEAYLNELLSEMEGEDEEETVKEQEEEEKEELKKELAEAYRTVKFLKNKINEVSLINSKLLYTGKIFRSHTLNETQKISILESFDRAKNIRETKLLYATISTTLKENKSRNTQPKKKGRLKESRASRPISSTKSGKVLQENRIVTRLQQLAGII
jgi:hypothetical protein